MVFTSVHQHQCQRSVVAGRVAAGLEWALSAAAAAQGVHCCVGRGVRGRARGTPCGGGSAVSVLGGRVSQRTARGAVDEVRRSAGGSGDAGMA